MGPEVTALLALIEKGGPYAVASIFAFLWWLERTDRKAAQASCAALTERVLNGLNNAGNAIGDLRLVVGLSRSDHQRGDAP